MRQISLRPALAEDESFLQSLYATTREQEMLLVDWDQKTQQQFLTMQFQAQLHHYRTHFPNAEQHLVLHEGEPIGRFYVYRAVNEIRLLDISLLPAWRNQGIGRQLMQALLTEAETSKRPLRLYVWQGNEGALRFYRRLGLQTVESEGMYILMENTT